MKFERRIAGLLVLFAAVAAIIWIMWGDAERRFPLREVPVAEAPAPPEPVRVIDPRRAALSRYIHSVNPDYPRPLVAANELLWCESAGGAPAPLVAAVVTVESRWGALLEEGDVNLGQVIGPTARSVFGGEAETRNQNLYQTSMYLAGCLGAEGGDARRAPARYNRGPGWPDRPEAEVYAGAVMRELGKVEL